MMQVKFRSLREIESEAQHLLDQYAHDKRWSPAAPVPIEKLIIFLGLHQDIVDLYEYLGVAKEKDSDLLGGLFFDEATIRVHSGIDPDDFPWLEGRFNFTLGHEVGHWVLHRGEYLALRGQVQMFDAPTPERIICRRSERSEPIEVQANRFASCVLMPRVLVQQVWRDKFGRGTSMSLSAKQCAIRTVAEQFCTSIEATSYRLQELGLLGAQRQPDLGV